MRVAAVSYRPALVAASGCLGVLVVSCGGTSAPPVTQQQRVSSYVAYAACLNKHGVQVQVARTGGLVWEASPGVPGPGSPQALGAERDCVALVPAGGRDQAPTAAQNAENFALMLRLASCMRAHGVPSFPDPSSSDGRIRLGFSPSDGINPQAPAFLAAEKRCKRDSLTLGGGT